MDVHMSGVSGLPTAPAWGSSSFSVGERSELYLSYLRLGDSASITVVDGGK